MRRHFETSAVLELVFASSLWGFGFIATAWALRELGPVALTGLRMFLAFALGFVICVGIPSLRRQLSFDQFKLAFWPGVFLCATMLLQTWGLKFTTVTKSGFITTLYVLIVPFMERALLGRRVPKYHMVYVFFALVGVALICDLTGSDQSRWTFGDSVTLACAFAASLQIVWFGKIQNRIRSSFVFNVFQTFWTGCLPFALMFWIEPPPLRLGPLPLAGMIELIVGSTMIAFSLQVRAQKKISPSVSSLIYLLESPFAALFGFLVLDETPSRQTLLGAAIILASLTASVVFSKEGTSVE
jgi:drug/metabolite transporter (DMT)-like permease